MVAIFILTARVISIFRVGPKSDAVPPTPVPLGTNELSIGAKLYNPHAGTNYVFTVTGLNPAYDFPDEDTRPGVKIRSEIIRGSSWVPRDNLNKFYVVQ